MVNPADMVITSGTLAKVRILQAVGNYIPEMFIDAVDNEMCFRLHRNGYLVCESNIPYEHHIGAPKVYTILFKRFWTPNYSPSRLYYTYRNSYSCFHIYRKGKDVKGLKKHCLKLKIKILLVESDKLKKLKAIKRGRVDAKRFYKALKQKYSFLEY